MVKFLASSFTVLLLTIAAVKAQINPALYPKINEVPPVTSPEVVAWLKEIDLTGAPTIELHVGAPPACPNPPIANECYWTCDGCAADDITACAAPNTWGLTFDDGPSTATPTLLDYLKTNKLSASFFVIGSNAIQYPDTLKREVTEGHHLASHTWSHHALTTLTNEQIVAEMKWTEKAVLEATGLRLKYMRPPYGDINNRVRFVLKKLGYIPVDWTGDAFDTNDWRIPTMTEAQVIDTFSKSLDTYVASDKAKGFYCLEHDVSSLTVNVALKLLPLGITRKINFASVAGCESDAQPYQAGSTAPMPTLSAGTSAGQPTATKGGATPSASATGVAGNGTVNGPTIVDPKNKSGASSIAVSGVFAAAAAAAVALILA
ncbi:chitin deacetylase [Mortierella hygrophila]|uniref:Chitin deacetylase n=1 Tax=Mortierella hygrophila TaxID=979708 RepID=A0A9P6FIF4_9FUNG|nr:chitin deacetylase [Mortierella hygrophila]KAF9552020.1 chitin deacetylase [Mortierella hygrophila]